VFVVLFVTYLTLITLLWTVFTIVFCRFFYLCAGLGHQLCLGTGSGAMETRGGKKRVELTETEDDLSENELKNTAMSSEGNQLIQPNLQESSGMASVLAMMVNLMQQQQKAMEHDRLREKERDKQWMKDLKEARVKEEEQEAQRRKERKEDIKRAIKREKEIELKRHRAQQGTEKRKDREEAQRRKEKMILSMPKMMI